MAETSSPPPLCADYDEFREGASIANRDVTPDGGVMIIRRGVNDGKLRVVVNWTVARRLIETP